MIPQKGTPSILFIPDVFKRHCHKDDFFEQKIIEDATNDSKQAYQYYRNEIDDYYGEKLPSIFESIDIWPKQTSLRCWYCTLSFSNMPIFIPRDIEPMTQKNKTGKYSIGVYGVFCSFGCAHQFIVAKRTTHSECVESVGKLRLLYKILYGGYMREYSSYPSPYDLSKFGGNMTIDEFKKKIDEFKSDNEISMY